LRDFNDNSLYNNKVDQAIDKYTYDPMHMFEIVRVWKEAINIYPLDSDTKVYRGINFSSKEEYEKFIESIKNNTLTTNYKTSWSPNKDVAEQFAITKPSYMEFMSRENWKQISEAEHEYITGFRGVVLTTVAKSNKCIDLRKCKYGKEPEIILPEGNYKVK
jgi:hypothetical protein